MGKFADELMPKFAESTEPTLDSFRVGTVAWVLQRYYEEMAEGERPMGEPMVYRLRALQRMPIAKMVALKLAKQDVIEFARWRLKQTWHGRQISAVTVNHDICLMAVAFKYGGSCWKDHEDLSDKPFKKAKPFLVNQRLISKSVPRDRRPTPEELERLIEHFEERDKHHCTQIPMALFTLWQPISGRRIGETCALLWCDWNREKRIILVRRMKDPRRPKSKWTALPPEATAFLEALWLALPDETKRLVTELGANDPRQPRIFPYNKRSVIAAYVQAKKVLGISGLRLHDSRRECASRLAAKGYTSRLIGLVTGHEPGSRVLDRTYVSLPAEEFHQIQPNEQAEARA